MKIQSLTFLCASSAALQVEMNPHEYIEPFRNSSDMHTILHYIFQNQNISSMTLQQFLSSDKSFDDNREAFLFSSVIKREYLLRKNKMNIFTEHIMLQKQLESSKKAIKKSEAIEK
jgi:hypothetical protein